MWIESETAMRPMAETSDPCTPHTSHYKNLAGGKRWTGVRRPEVDLYPVQMKLRFKVAEREKRNNRFKLPERRGKC